jgi:hypothetical protein
MPWSYAWTRRRKFRPLTAPNRCCLYARGSGTPHPRLQTPGLFAALELKTHKVIAQLQHQQHFSLEDSLAASVDRCKSDRARQSRRSVRVRIFNQLVRSKPWRGSSSLEGVDTSGPTSRQRLLSAVVGAIGVSGCRDHPGPKRGPDSKLEQHGAIAGPAPLSPCTVLHPPEEKRENRVPMDAGCQMLSTVRADGRARVGKSEYVRPVYARRAKPESEIRVVGAKNWNQRTNPRRHAELCISEMSRGSFCSFLGTKPASQFGGFARL